MKEFERIWEHLLKILVFWFLFPPNITSNKRTLLFSLVRSVSLVYMSVRIFQIWYIKKNYPGLLWSESKSPIVDFATNTAQGTLWPKTCVIESHKLLSHAICPCIIHHLPKWRNLFFLFTQHLLINNQQHSPQQHQQQYRDNRLSSICLSQIHINLMLF